MGLLKMIWALVYNNATMALKALSDGACAVVDDSLFHNLTVGETGASCYGGRLLQGRYMQNYNTDGYNANSSCILIHQRNH